MVSRQVMAELGALLEDEPAPPAPPESVPRSVALLLESLGDEVGGPGHRIPRAKVADDLGNQILDLLWEPIAEIDGPRIEKRLTKLRHLFDEVPTGPPACALLKRLSTSGDLIADFDYRLSRQSRTELRQGLRDRCGQTLPPDPPDPVVPDPKPDSKVDPKPPQKPTDPTKPAVRLLETIGEFELKTEERRIKTLEKFEIYAWLEASLQIGFEGTDAERAVIKTRWQNGEFKPEMEVELTDVLGVDFEGEWDKKPELRMKRDIAINDRFTLTPKAKLNPLEPFELEGSVSTPGFPLSIGGVGFKIKGEIKGIAVVRLAWRRLIKKKVKERLKDAIRDLGKKLVDFFASKFVKDRLRQILIAVAGLMLVKLLFDDDDKPSKDDPMATPPDPKDVLGFDPVLSVAQGQDSARKRLLEEAREYRNAFAIAFGDTLSQLARPDWRQRLAAMTTFKVYGFVNLPKAAPDDAKAWRIWAVDADKRRYDSVDLRDDAYVRRFRTNEAALMWAVLAFLVRGGQTEDSIKTAIATAHQQATAAGMAAAVMQVKSMIERETYEFKDEKGRKQTRSGVLTWDEMAAAARAAEPDDLTRQRRLARLVTDVLPRLQ
jgi:hypothetical protein